MKAAARHRPGVMNKTEAAYALVLMGRKAMGEIREWRFEPLKLKLAKATYYTPDFMVIDRDGLIELVDVKHMRKDKGGTYRIHKEDDAAVKIKVAARAFPEFLFVLAAKRPRAVGDGWVYEEVTP